MHAEREDGTIRRGAAVTAPLPLAKNLPDPGAYARAWRAVLAAPDDAHVPPRVAWECGDTVAQVRESFRRALHDRISARGGKPRSRGRRDCYDHRAACWRDQRAVQEYRLSRIVRRGSGLETREARARFPDVQAAMTERDW